MPSFGGDDGGDPLARKLELAEEFRQIGDTEGARDLLQEVIAKASGALKTKAQSMLTTCCLRSLPAADAAMRLALGISYRGSAYHGWQSQPDGATVQDRARSGAFGFAARAGVARSAPGAPMPACMR